MISVSQKPWEIGGETGLKPQKCDPRRRILSHAQTVFFPCPTNTLYKRERQPSNQVVPCSNHGGRNVSALFLWEIIGVAGNNSLHRLRFRQISFVDSLGRLSTRVTQKCLSAFQRFFVGTGLGAQVVEGEADSSCIHEFPHKSLPYR